MCKAFSDEEINTLAGSMKPTVLQKGAVIFNEGEQTRCCLFLLQGRVRVIKKVNNKRKIDVGLLAPGAIVGHEGLLDGAPYVASFVARDEHIVGVYLHVLTFNQLLSSGSGAATKMLDWFAADFAQRLRAATERLRSLTDRRDANLKREVVLQAARALSIPPIEEPDFSDLDLRFKQ